MAERLKPSVALASVCLSIWLTMPAAVGASHHGQGVADEVTLRMSYQQAPVAGAHAQIIASASLDDGDPAVGVGIEFLRQVDFLGPRLISLGSATTGASGAARITLDTTQGKLRVIARVAGNDLYLPAEVAQEINLQAIPDVGSPGGPATPDGQPNLAIVATVMPPLLALTAFLIWLVLLGLIAVTVLAIRRGRTDAT